MGPDRVAILAHRFNDGLRQLLLQLPVFLLQMSQSTRVTGFHTSTFWPFRLCAGLLKDTVAPARLSCRITSLGLRSTQTICSSENLIFFMGPVNRRWAQLPGGPTN